MSEVELISKVTSLNWAEFNRPEYYSALEIPKSFTRLIDLRDESSKWDTYNQFLFSIGNNHGGTYYPVISEALPIIIEIIRSSNFEIVRNCSLEIITEIYHFEPDVSRNPTIDFNQLEIFVRSAIKEFIASYNTRESARNTQLIDDLKESIENPAST